MPTCRNRVHGYGGLRIKLKRINDCEVFWSRGNFKLQLKVDNGAQGNIPEK